MNAPAGSEWRRWTPFKRLLAHVMSPTHSRRALHDPPTSDISQHVISSDPLGTSTTASAQDAVAKKEQPSGMSTIREGAHARGQGSERLTSPGAARNRTREPIADMNLKPSMSPTTKKRENRVVSNAPNARARSRGSTRRYDATGPARDRAPAAPAAAAKA